MPKKIQYYLLHTLGMLLFISIPILSSPDLDSPQMWSIRPFQRNFLSYILLLFFFYANYLYFIPQFYFTSRRYLFFTVIVLCFVVVAFLPHILLPGQSAMVPGYGFRNRPPHHGNIIPPVDGGSIFQFLLVFLLSFLLRLNKRLNYIQNEKLRTEVSYLKAQIKPHFLFNTLNSLYALALEKSDDAPEAILKLSGMMRYVVSESSKDSVALDKEIDYIKNYILLQQLRMDEGTQFSFSIKGSTSGKAISPLLLIPFIENAFKYGINPEEESSITIEIDIKETELLLNIKNNKVTHPVNPEEKSEMGIDNTRQRLQYLYPKKHKLLIFETPETFTVKLTVTLH